MNESEIFETKSNEFDKQDNSDSEEVVSDNVVEEIKEVKTKTKKGRKPLSDERKAVLRENLKRGREKSIETRKRNRELKALEKEEKIKAQDDKLLKALELKRNKKNNETSLLEQIADLKKKLEEKEKKPIKEEKEPQAQAKQSEPKSQPKSQPKSEPKPLASKPIPIPQISQAQKNKNLYKMMRGIR